MIALRCLELYFGTDNEVANDVPSVTRPRRAFDFSESCEVVLDIITKETPESAYPDPSKWDIQPFIAHKRASRPKCTLEKLKDAILDGTHPYAASLAELGGLVRINDENDRITVDSVRHNELMQRIDGVGDGIRSRGENRFFTS
ncbi:uncharacterized protein LOC110663401 [Hevea brasiliensis]|uniref:uncharacterized protein LOC110663401 n=1 Tax=Hevea brasiliensis TaxID=3981 RepID=UPI0025F92077|nr:uncharacterized protein LOC110663401 [Hevea brasiliensis]XP_057999798.1 uncharacterized protein LOC110663401 [Hevea brasiliensis]